MRPENSGFLLPEPPVSLKDVLLLLCPCSGGSRGNLSGHSFMMKSKACREKDISFPKSLENEERRWKTLWQSTDRVLPNNLLLAIGDCDEDAFPNIHQLLVISTVICTPPIISAEAERSFSFETNQDLL